MKSGSFTDSQIKKKMVKFGLVSNESDANISEIMEEYGIVFLPNFEISKINSNTNLFFDDSLNHILDVQHRAREINLNIKSIFCYPNKMNELYIDDIKKEYYDDDEYIFQKTQDVLFDEEFKSFLQNDSLQKVGSGLNTTVMNEIIENEKKFSIKRQYFFDFDMLLNQFGGLNFGFIKEDEELKPQLELYAKYLFSNHVSIKGGFEPINGRFRTMQKMFKQIGAKRIYVVTSNSFANASSNYYQHFIILLREILPSFMVSHLICANDYFEKKKSSAIESIILQQPSSLRSRFTNRTAVSTRRNAISTRPTSVSTRRNAVSTRPTSVSTRPTSVSTRPTSVSTRPISVSQPFLFKSKIASKPSSKDSRVTKKRGGNSKKK